MILNISRAAFFQQCRKKTKNLFILGQQPPPAEPLTVGGAYHAGCAVLTATKDRKAALAASEVEFRERMKGAKLLPEEVSIMEANIELVKRMLNAQADMYEHDDWIVLKPEVNFCVKLPNTHHHCVFFHKILHPDEPTHSCKDPLCIQPHYLKGRTDALLSWKNMIWIMERKTSGVLGDIYWSQWQLATQPTGYIYGVQEATGVRAHGFILEKTTKPRKNASDPFKITIEREPFLRSEADLREFEREFPQIADDYEHAYVNDTWYKNTAACIDWNRKCWFLDQCKRNQQVSAGEFGQRDPDYVDAEYYKILGLKVPWEETKINETDSPVLGGA
jgi:hypothetical protein